MPSASEPFATMIRIRQAVLALALFAVRCAGDAADVRRDAVPPARAAKAPAKVSRSFAASGITTVVMRAADAARATVHYADHGTIEVSGIPSGGAAGYHSGDPNWRETPATEWGLDFSGKQFGNVLVISTKNEMAYIHHSYSLHSLVLSVPLAVQVVPVARQLNENGAPDLSPPPSNEPGPPAGAAPRT